MVEKFFFLHVCLDKGNEEHVLNEGNAPQKFKLSVNGGNKWKRGGVDSGSPPPQFPFIEYPDLLRNFFIKDINK